MKISYNWLKSYLPIDESPAEVAEILTDIGLEVEGEEHVDSIRGGLKGLVIGKVLSCEKHPNADRLRVTTVDVGAESPIDIVCGAPNVAAGQTVVVATPKTTIYPTKGEPLTIKKGKIRGAASNGMICAEDEIGLGEGHDGILVLEDAVAPGTAAADVFKVESDVVFEIGLTPNRSDATSHLGVAQDLAAALRVQKSKEVSVTRPVATIAEYEATPLKIELVDAEACPRYTGVCIEDFKVGPSPKWLTTRLESIGVRPISNIVDITNFILHEYGQPLHAYDMDKIGGGGIKVQTLPEGTKFTTLDEKERSLRASDLMICDANDKPMCIGGVFGGIDSGVTDGTTKIFLEAAHFNAKSIRRTSTKHDLRTDAAKVFEKGSDPNISVEALKRAVSLISEIGGGKVSSAIYDLYPTKIEPAEIEVAFATVNRVLGIDLDQDTVKSILEALEIEILSSDDTSLKVAVPTNKADVLREIDVVEEILRIYGFNNIPIPEHFKFIPQNTTSTYALRNKVADYLAGAGFLEMMGLSLSRSKYLESGLFPFEKESLVYVNNTSTQELDIMRPTTLFNTLESVAHNLNRQQSSVRLFELGKKYKKDGDGFVETNVLTVSLSGVYQSENWLSKNRNFHGFYTLKAVVEQILNLLGISNLKIEKLEDGLWSYGLKASRGPFNVVKVGSIKPAICNYFGIKTEVLFAEFDWDALVKLKTKSTKYSELQKYPTIKRDLAMVIDQHVQYEEIIGVIKKTEKKNIESISLFDVFEDADKLGEGKKSYAISIIFQNPNKTMVDKEVEKIMTKIIYNLENNLKVTIRK